ncbi:MAG: hypothetical protein Q7T82_06030 [Armatimonadota bacterium]|nr:hypothetical protein [Armatimonadota bacterium]
MHQDILPPRSKPYFPMILANGSDVVLVDYSGSMQCHSGHLHLEQHQGALCGWQKTTHREKGRHMFSVAFFPYRIMRPDNDVYEIGWFDQRFDPRTATLVTEVRSKILHLRFTTFLADGQPLYAERIEVLWIDPEAQPKIALLAQQMADPRVAQVSFGRGDAAQVVGEYTLSEIEGSLRVAVVARRQAVHDGTQSHTGYLEVRDLKPGDVIDRFVTMQDTSHTEQPENACATAIENALAKGFEKLHEEHSEAWQSYQATTEVTLPDPEWDYSYRLGLYLMRASQHPSGYAVHGTYNVLWGGGSCCSADFIFFTRGWASANQKASVQALADYYESGAGPMAREYARQIGRPGLNYPWFFNIFGRDLFFDDAVSARAAGIQKGNIASMATEIYDIYRFFGDTDDLRKRLPVIKDMLDFLLAEIIVQEGDRWSTGSLIGSDENVERVNDIGHLLKLIRAMRDYQEGCRALGLPEDERYAAAIKGLSVTMQENYRDGVLYPWKGATEVLTTNVMCYAENMPEGINAKSIWASHRSDSGEWGLSADNAGRDPNMVWPWLEASTAVAFSTIDPKLSYRRLKNALRFTDMHGFFVEKIRPDGFWINIGYSTPHACFVWAVNSLLATDNGKRLTIAAGLPSAWQDYSFAGIHTPSGYAVSLDVQGGRVKRLVITNTRPETRQIRLRLLSPGHADARNEMLTLGPGENVLF